MKKAKLTKQMLILTTPEEHQFVKELSDELDLSMGELVRLMIREKKNFSLSHNTKTDFRQLSLM